MHARTHARTHAHTSQHALEKVQVGVFLVYTYQLDFCLCNV